MNTGIPTPADLNLERTHMLCDIIETIFEHHGIASSLAHLYAVVFSSTEQPVRLTDAAQIAGVAKSTASVGLRKLEAAGLLCKQKSDHDRQDAYAPNPAAVQLLLTQIEQILMPTFVQLHQLHHVLKAQLVDPTTNHDGRNNLTCRIQETRAATQQLGRVIEALRAKPPSQVQSHVAPTIPFRIAGDTAEVDGLPSSLRLQ